MEDAFASFDSWKACAAAAGEKGGGLRGMSKSEVHAYWLAEKYAGIWRRKAQKTAQFQSTLRQASWLRSMLFNPSSQTARRATCDMIASLCHGGTRQRQILDLLCSFLDDVGVAGEHSQEYLELLGSLTNDPASQWKSYLAMRGILPRIGNLITQEIEYLLEREETTLSSNLSQGYALKMLTGA